FVPIVLMNQILSVLGGDAEIARILLIKILKKDRRLNPFIIAARLGYRDQRLIELELDSRFFNNLFQADADLIAGDRAAMDAGDAVFQSGRDGLFGYFGNQNVDRTSLDQELAAQ